MLTSPIPAQPKSSWLSTDQDDPRYTVCLIALSRETRLAALITLIEENCRSQSRFEFNVSKCVFLDCQDTKARRAAFRLWSDLKVRLVCTDNQAVWERHHSERSLTSSLRLASMRGRSILRANTMLAESRGRILRSPWLERRMDMIKLTHRPPEREGPIEGVISLFRPSLRQAIVKGGLAAICAYYARLKIRLRNPPESKSSSWQRQGETAVL